MCFMLQLPYKYMFMMQLKCQHIVVGTMLCLQFTTNVAANTLLIAFRITYTFGN